MDLRLSKKILIIVIISLFVLTFFSQSALGVDMGVAGYIKYNDGSHVSSGVLVTLTNNNTSYSETTTTDENGLYNLGSIIGDNGDIIWGNVSYIGNSNGNSVVFDSSLLFLWFNITISEDITTLYVDDDFNSSSTGWHINAYNSIQAAIDAATAGNTIYVYNGTYNENIAISKSINLTGEDKNNTIINNNGGNNIITISTSYVNISNFTINGSSVGVKFQTNSNYCNISNNIIQNNFWGVYIYHSSNNSITGNIIQNNTNDGIRIRYSSSTNNTVSGNTIRNNGNDGIRIRTSSPYNTITGNTIQNNTIHGIRVTDTSYNTTITYNIIETNKDGIYLGTSDSNTISNNTVQSNTLDGIILETSNSNNITGNTIQSNNDDAIVLRSSINNNISQNIIQDNGDDAIYLDSSSENTIICNNNVYNNSDGINLVDLTDISITGNTFFKNSITLSGDNINYYFHNITNNTVNGKPFYYYKNQSDINIVNNTGGVILVNCTNITVENATINNTDIAIYIVFSSSNHIINNTLDNNSKEGIYFYNCSENTISGNTLTNSSIRLSGENLSYFIHNITSNTVNGKTFYYYKNQSDISILSNAGGVILANCTNSTVNGVNITDIKVGIHLAYSSRSNITNCNFSNNSYDVLLTQSDNNTISGCSTVYSNSSSIYLDSSSNNTINENSILNIDYIGIFLTSESDNNTISSNTLQNNSFRYANTYGIYVLGCNYTNITQNYIYNNSYGVSVDNSNKTTIQANIIQNNSGFDNWGGGIYLYKSKNNIIIENIVQNSFYGILFYSSSNYNSVYHNDLINNSHNGYDDISCVDNTWDDNSSEGNYWSDYSIVDNNTDGIGDTAQDVSGGSNSQDRYPLTGPYSERPYKATCSSPSNGATGISTSPTLQVLVTDPNNNSMNVSFYDASSDSLINTDTSVSNASTASTTWTSRSYATTYSWYVVANNSRYITKSETWSFTTQSNPGSSNNGGSEDDTDQDEEFDTTRNEVETLYNITLEQNFSADDTNGDGIIELDEFTDPNNILNAERLINLNNNSTFLISVNNNINDIFIWDTKADTINQVTYNKIIDTNTSTDTQNNTYTTIININKSNWVYIEIDDSYPDIQNLTVKTSEGRIISSDMIWRENNKIYVLDDPDTEYHFIYHYTILPPVFDPIDKTIFNISEFTVKITYNETVNIIRATLNNESITNALISIDKQIFTYNSEKNLTNGDYTLSITVEDNENNTRTDTALYTIKLEEKTKKEKQSNPEDESSLFLFLIGISIIIIFVFIYLIKKYR